MNFSANDAVPAPLFGFSFTLKFFMATVGLPVSLSTETAFFASGTEDDDVTPAGRVGTSHLIVPGPSALTRNVNVWSKLSFFLSSMFCNAPCFSITGFTAFTTMSKLLGVMASWLRARNVMLMVLSPLEPKANPPETSGDVKAPLKIPVFLSRLSPLGSLVLSAGRTSKLTG